MDKVQFICTLSGLIICTYTDIRERKIYLVALIIMAIEALVVNVYRILIVWNANFHMASDIWNYLAGPLLVFSVLVAISIITNESIGMGDVYMIGVVCLQTGITVAVKILGIAVIITGIAATISLLVCGYQKNKSFPFAPFMLLGLLIYVFVEKQI